MGEFRTRKRKLDDRVDHNVYYDKYMGTLNYNVAFSGGETTIDVNNRAMWNDFRRILKEYGKSPTNLDIGGEFTHTKATVENLDYARGWKIPHNDRTYSGGLYAYVNGCEFQKNASPWKPVGLPNDSEMDQYGATAISRCSPTNPHVDLMTSLGELYRDGLPSLPGLTTKREGLSPSSVGSEYLNYEFGIAPTVSDIKNIAKTMRNAETYIAQYLRDSGRLIRRRYEFPIEVETSKRLIASGRIPVNNGASDGRFYSASGDLWETIETTTKTWFSGAFTYYADPNSVGEVRSFLKQAQHLTGLRLDLESYYNLMPWSWAIDWFTNLGDVVNNVTMFVQDGLVMRWGYVMREVTRSTTYALEGCRSLGGAPVTAEQRLVYVNQRRRRATPFGFGLSESSFTARQWAILAALGISQGGRLRAM